MRTFSDAELDLKKKELRQQLVGLLEQFGASNSGLPVHVMISTLGEVLIQFSSTQSSPEQTIIFLGHLQDVVQRFIPAAGGPAGAPPPPAAA